MPARRRPQARSVFVNCPFDRDYKDLFNALVFGIHDCGFYVRCALEIHTGQLRFQTICNLIRACRYGIHDLSRMHYEQFLNALPDICKDRRLGRDHRSLPFPDCVYLVEGWLLENSWRPSGSQT